VRARYALALGFAFLSSAACKSHVTQGTGGSSTTGAGGAPAKPPVTTVTHPAQPPLPGQSDCTVTVTDNVKYEGATHETVCNQIHYVSNPPSSGDHWPVWAAFKEYTTHVPREMFVHDMEHGAVVMLYNCPSGACPDVVTAFEKARDDFGPDTLCVTGDPMGPKSRIVITPDNQIPAPIALSAWQSTYVATCIDPPSLLDFVKKHYGHGTEDFCSDGVDPTDPNGAVAACMPLPY